MCLAVPMQITSIEGQTGRCQIGGIEREVNLFLLGDELLQAGDFVLVHVGYAIQKVDRAAAAAAWQLIDLGELAAGAGDA